MEAVVCLPMQLIVNDCQFKWQLQTQITNKYEAFHLERRLELLAVAGQEVAEALDSVFQLGSPRQGDHAEVVRVWPVKTSALDHQDLLRAQDIQHQLGIVVNLVDIRVQAWEAVQSTHRLGDGNARDLVELLVGHVALLEQASALTGEPVDGLAAAQSNLNCMLCRNVRAQAGARQ